MLNVGLLISQSSYHSSTVTLSRKNSNSSANSNDPDALSDDPNYKESVDFNERLGLEKSKTHTKAGLKFMQPSFI